MSFLNVEDQLGFSPEKLHKVNLFETADLFCDVYGLEPGQGQKPHTHSDATKFYYVLQGQGEFRVGDVTRKLSAGELAYAEPGEVHGVMNTSTERLVLLVAMAPNPNVAREERARK